MTHKLSSLVVLCSVAFVLLAGSFVHGQVMSDVAETWTKPYGMPAYSDVSLRYGWKRTTFPTINDAKDAIEGFHANRVDWFYGSGHGCPTTDYPQDVKDFITWCHNRDMVFGAAVNTLTTDSAYKLPGTCEFFPGRWQGDPDGSGFRSAYIDWVEIAIDAGADAVQTDDIGFIRACGSATTPSISTIRTWANYVNGEVLDYDDSIVLTRNEQNIDASDKMSFDFVIKDDHVAADPSYYYDKSVEYRNANSHYMNHSQVYPTESITRTMISLHYAVGLHMICPWDAFTSLNDPRYFGDPADSADIYGFVRCLGQSGYMDDKEDAAVGGYDLNETRYTTDPLTIISGNTGMSMFARATPDDPDAPIIVHLIKVTGTGATNVGLLTESFFGGAPLDIELWTRRPYNSAEHASAESSGDYTGLKWDRTGDITVTENGAWTNVTLPELYPWGVLIVNKKYYKVINDYDQKVLAQASGSSNVQVETYSSGDDRQLWDITDLGSGWFSFKNKATGQLMSRVWTDGTGTNVYCRTSGTYATAWRVDSYQGDYKKLVNELDYKWMSRHSTNGNCYVRNDNNFASGWKFEIVD